MRSVLAAAIVLAALPAFGFEGGNYEGRATFVVGNRNCPTQGPALNVEVGADGKVSGGVRTLSQAAPISGSVGPDGKLVASYKASAASDVVNIEALLTDSRLEGFTQSPTCRYKISLGRQ